MGGRAGLGGPPGHARGGTAPCTRKAAGSHSAAAVAGLVALANFFQYVWSVSKATTTCRGLSDTR